MKVVFLDRDGTLIWEPPETRQVDRLEDLRLLPGVLPGLLALRRAGFELVMVSNQDGLGTAAFPRSAFEGPQEELLRLLRNRGIEFAQVFICPHRAADRCSCRKPAIGLVRDWVADNAVDLSESLAIGDRDTDAEFAQNLGVPYVRVPVNSPFPRFSYVSRKTRETDVSVFLNLDGSGRARVATGIGFLDHMLDLLARHALMDLRLKTRGDLAVDEHHTTEDTALALGQAIAEALGEKRGIERYGFWVPMDEALAEAVLDLSGRPYFVFRGHFRREVVGGLPTELVPHFFESFAQALRCNLHLRLHRGGNDHHKIEALFKALARSLRQALRYCPHEPGVPSTKGVL